MIDRLVRSRHFSYDADGRLTGETAGSTTRTYSYDAADNLLTAADNDGIYTFTYDALHRPTTEKQPFGLTLTNTFDAVGNRTKREDNFGGILTSTYDAADRLTKREFGGSGQTPLRIDVTYTNRDQMETLTRYSDLAGTTKVGSSTYVYDAPGRLQNLQHRNGSGSLLANYTYTYDLASRVTSETLNGTTTNFGYDNTDQLTSDGSNSYSFDANGNRTMTGYTTGTGNRLTNDGTWTYTYDAEGNLTKKSKGPNAETWVYVYDEWNQMTTARQEATDGGTVQLRVTYVYDVFGDRLEESKWKQTPGTTTTARFGYDQGNIWADLDGSNNLTTRRQYLDGVDQVFAKIAGGSPSWYLPDRLGSIRDVTNSSGSVTGHVDYDGFGNITSDTVGASDRYKFTGREYDADLQSSGEWRVESDEWRVVSDEWRVGSEEWRVGSGEHPPLSDGISVPRV